MTARARQVTADALMLAALAALVPGSLLAAVAYGPAVGAAVAGAAVVVMVGAWAVQR